MKKTTKFIDTPMLTAEDGILKSCFLSKAYVAERGDAVLPGQSVHEFAVLRQVKKIQDCLHEFIAMWSMEAKRTDDGADYVFTMWDKDGVEIGIASLHCARKEATL